MKPPRSATSGRRRRIPQPWPAGRPFRILSIDGGGIRGIFPATVLANFEKHFLNGESVAPYFDMIAGTSTGGIIALGLAAGRNASDLANLYVKKGNLIFPPLPPRRLGRFLSLWRWARQLFKFRYDRSAIRALLVDVLGDRMINSARTRLCIPALEGQHGEVYIFKTPHHSDYYLDGVQPMVSVAMATSAAPTFFQPLADEGHMLVDGGTWANNPVMIAVVDAMTCFEVRREDIQVLSIGCGDGAYALQQSKISRGGLLHWRDLIFTVMRLQSQNAIGQTRLLLGPESVVRIDPPPLIPDIELDDWLGACSILPALADNAATENLDAVQKFFCQKAEPWRPLA